MLVQKDVTNQIEEMLLKALNNVENDYMEMTYGRVAAEVQRPEHAFSSELYHQLRKLQENEAEYFGFGLNQSLKFHADLNKMSYHIKDIPCIKKINPKSTRPDIVLHGGQNNTNFQHLAIEIKMAGVRYDDIEKDLLKLLYYKLSPLNFENAIFVFSGNVTVLDNFLLDDFSNNTKNCLKENKIYFALRENVEIEGAWALYELK
jgi:hypothetical protein